MNDEYKMTPSGEFVIYGYLEAEDQSEEAVRKQYQMMDRAIDTYLSLLHSRAFRLDSLLGTVPITKLYSCHYIDVWIRVCVNGRFHTIVKLRRTMSISHLG